MTKPGRVPKPTKLRVLHGDRKDRINDSEPVPALKEIVAPDWLSPGALTIWDSHAPDLIHKGVLTAWDVQEFGVWCDAAARVAEIARHQNLIETTEGRYVTKGARGSVRSPMFAAWKECAETMLKYGAHFGLSPSDRSRISVGKPASGNDKDAARFFS